MNPFMRLKAILWNQIKAFENEKKVDDEMRIIE